MKVQVEVPDSYIHGALAEPHSRYWACAATWNPETCEGFAHERDGDRRHTLAKGRLKVALTTMSERFPKHFARLMSGDCDGLTGDLLLQLMCFGEEKYA